MNMDTNKRKIGFAPQTSLIPASALESNRVLNVRLEEDEEVEWTWTYWPNGERSVTGYTIHKKVPEIATKQSSSRRFERKRRLKRSLLRNF
jgi:hypothetical protein